MTEQCLGCSFQWTAADLIERVYQTDVAALNRWTAKIARGNRGGAVADMRNWLGFASARGLGLTFKPAVLVLALAEKVEWERQEKLRRRTEGATPPHWQKYLAKLRGEGGSHAEETVAGANQAGADDSFWKDADIPILPLQDEGPPASLSVCPKRVRTGRMEDPARVAFLERQTRALFGVKSRERGFSGYVMLVFPRFLLLENVAREHAAYVLPLAESIPERGAGVEDIVGHLRSVLERVPTKGALRAKGAKKIAHLGAWQQRLQKVIDASL